MKAKVIIAACALAGMCACASVKPGSGRAALKHHSDSPTTTFDLARYDKGSGTCNAGAIQLLSANEFRELTSSWGTAKPEGVDCDKARIVRMPHVTDYPVGSDGSVATGAAHVLVRIHADGTLESARTVCATSRAFANAAESTASRLSYAPSRCGDNPVPASFILPLAYDPN